MEDNTVIGVAKQAAGRVESAAGALTGDARTEIRGKIREAGGVVQQRYGETTDAVRDMVGSRSMAALLAAGAAGLVVGLFLNRR
jgi:uncharacterized protein YjbJ (UPF0337 family)